MRSYCVHIRDVPQNVYDHLNIISIKVLFTTQATSFIQLTDSNSFKLRNVFNRKSINHHDTKEKFLLSTTHNADCYDRQSHLRLLVRCALFTPLCGTYCLKTKY